MLRRVLAVVLLCSLAALAQRGPRERRQPQGADLATLSVKITSDNSGPLPRLRVQLATTGGVPVFDTQCSQQGNAEFQMVPPGRYRLRVLGPELDATVDSDAFEIRRLESVHFETIHVKLRTQVATAGSPGPPVSVAEMNVPKEARQEAEKGGEALEKNEPRKAIEHFRKAVEIYPQYASAYNNLGVSWTKLGDSQAARKMFEQAIAADANYPFAYVNLSRIMMQEKNYEGVQQMLGKTLALDPANTEALMMLGTAELLSGKYDAAVASSRKLHAMPHERYAGIHLVAGDALQHQALNAAAVQEYELYLKEYPASPRAADVRKVIAELSASASKMAPAPGHATRP